MPDHLNIEFAYYDYDEDTGSDLNLRTGSIIRWYKVIRKIIENHQA